MVQPVRAVHQVGRAVVPMLRSSVKVKKTIPEGKTRGAENWVDTAITSVRISWFRGAGRTILHYTLWGIGSARCAESSSS